MKMGLSVGKVLLLHHATMRDFSLDGIRLQSEQTLNVPTRSTALNFFVVHINFFV